MGLGQSRSHTPSLVGAQFQGWREQRWLEDEEGDWSQSTSLGATTMDVLRDRFGEASFWDAPSWQPWAPGGERMDVWGTGGTRPGPGSKLLLASPKLRLKPRRPVPPDEREEDRVSHGPPSSLGEALRGADPSAARVEEEAGAGRWRGQRIAPQEGRA